MKKSARLLSFVLAAVMSIGLLAACGNNPSSASETTPTDPGTAAQNTDTPLVIGYDEFSEKFSPFYGKTAYDMDVVRITGIQLMNNDRTGAILYNAADGETVSYNGVDYYYEGLSNITVDQHDGLTTYTFALRDDVKFGDGEPLTADDLIFTFYVLLDPTYEGTAVMSALDIVGYQNYKYNNSAAESVDVSDADVAAELANPSEEVEAAVQEVVEAALAADYAYCQAYYDPEDFEANEEDSDALAHRKSLVTSAGMMFAFYYAGDMDALVGMSDDEIYAAVVEEYYYDYEGVDETAAAQGIAREYLVEQAAIAAGGEEVNYISGIVKEDDYTVSVTLNGFDAAAIYNMSLDAVAPAHYYGDGTFDYDSNNFGFTRGDLSGINAKTTQPLGAGPYNFVEYTNGVVYLEANPYYYKGEPATKYIQLRETPREDMTDAVLNGSVDIAQPDYNRTETEKIAGENSNGELVGDVLTTANYDFRGYGYIGINSANVNVGGEPGSDASKALRAALATVLAVHRDVPIESYYGDAASLINYPISNTSWAAPQKSDADYKVAFSTGLDGSDLYTAGMGMDEKYAAALEAALEYFEAAGYTVEDGQVVAAPEGASMTYELIIPAGGKGDHPSFNLVSNASEALASIGFDLNINDPSDSNELWNSIDANTHELWCAAWSVTLDPDMYQVYHSSNGIGLPNSTNSNNYNVADAELDDLIMMARTSDDQNYRKTLYKAALDIIIEWAVEVPVYQRQEAMLYSTERVASFTPDVTTNYEWWREIETIALS